MNTTHRELPMLAGIGGLIRWFEELASLLSGPLLTLGLGISLVDLLTDGQLLAHQPMLLYTWAISQAVGVDSQLIGAFDKARRAIRERRWFTLIGLLILGGALGYVAWISAQVFGVTQAEGISTAQALSQLGFDQNGWLIQRSLLSVVLVALSGFNRYSPPAQASLEDEKAKLERELQLEPLRQRVREQKTVGAVGLARRAVNAAVGTKNQDERMPTADDEQPELDNSQPENPPDATFGIAWGGQPTGDDTPAASKKQSTKRRQRKPEPVIKLVAPHESAEAKVRRVWQPGMSLRQLAIKAGVSHSTASKYSALLEAENAKTSAQIAQ